MGLTGPHLPLQRSCCRYVGNLAVVTAPTETHFLAWVPKGQASSATGEAKWSGSPFEAQSLTAANLHHLEQRGGKNGPHTSRPGTRVQLKTPLCHLEVMFTSSNHLSLGWEGQLASASLVSCSRRETFLPSLPSICASISPSPALPLKAAIFKFCLGSVSAAPILLQPTHTCCCPTFSFLVSRSCAGERAAPLG